LAYRGSSPQQARRYKRRRGTGGCEGEHSIQKRSMDKNHIPREKQVREGRTNTSPYSWTFWAQTLEHSGTLDTPRQIQTSHAA
jgi:hypothetical protein